MTRYNTGTSDILNLGSEIKITLKGINDLFRGVFLLLCSWMIGSASILSMSQEVQSTNCFKNTGRSRSRSSGASLARFCADWHIFIT